jgi:Mg-chelatase subunit ChlD
MPNPNYTHILFILDRSGSMGERGKAEAAIGGINHFTDEQAEQEGKCTATLVQFDTQEPYEVVYSMQAIDAVERRDPSNFRPRGGTPLLDCIGAAITTELAAIESMHDADQPGLVLVNVLTDGEENSSREWTLDRIRTLLQEVQDKGWKVMYTGAGIDAFADAQRLGLAAGTVAQVGGHAKGVQASYAASSSYATRARAATSRGLEVDASYDASERGLIDSGS